MMITNNLNTIKYFTSILLVGLVLTTTSCKLSKKTIPSVVAKKEMVNVPKERPVLLPGCYNEDETKQCLLQAANYYIVKGFSQDLLTQLNVTYGEKNINANFTVDKTGEVVNVVVTANDEKLIPDAIRFIQSLPIMKPAFHNSVPIAREFHTTVSFEFSKPLTIEEGNETILVDTPPIYPGCKGSNTELHKCFDRNINNHIARNFNADIANELGLSGRKRISMKFSIDRNGNITNIKARGPHNILELEAIKTLMKFPKIQPAISNGENVEVKFSLPIRFVVD